VLLYGTAAAAMRVASTSTVAAAAAAAVKSRPLALSRHLARHITCLRLFYLLLLLLLLLLSRAELLRLAAGILLGTSLVFASAVPFPRTPFLSPPLLPSAAAPAAAAVVVANIHVQQEQRKVKSWHLAHIAAAAKLSYGVCINAHLFECNYRLTEVCTSSRTTPSHHSQWANAALPPQASMAASTTHSLW
jgi:hypothetical protein